MARHIHPVITGIILFPVILASCGSPQAVTPGQSPSNSTPAAEATSAAATPTENVSLPETSATLTPTPTADTADDENGIDCASPASLTPAMTEGPYYKEGAPERTSLLEEDTPGTRLLLSGYVLSQDCRPVAGAWLDFWQTDGNGQYDNAGYRMRGFQYTDESGRYVLETVVPGEYPGRTAHIHVKVQAPGGPVLTTQLFFPGVRQNETDRIFSPLLLVAMQDGEGGKVAAFNFVVETP